MAPYCHSLAFTKQVSDFKRRTGNLARADSGKIQAGEFHQSPGNSKGASFSNIQRTGCSGRARVTVDRDIFNCSACIDLNTTAQTQGIYGICVSQIFFRKRQAQDIFLLWHDRIKSVGKQAIISIVCSKCHCIADVGNRLVFRITQQQLSEVILI